MYMSLGISGPSILSAIHLADSKIGKAPAKPHHTLVIRLNTKTLYRFSDTECVLLRGDAIFIPSGVSYHVSVIGGSSEYLVVRFLADVSEKDPIILHCDELGETLMLHSELCRSMIFDSDKSRYRALSLFYRILSGLSSGTANNHYMNSKSISLIRPALLHLENNIFSSELVTGELHDLCGISDFYFRSIFKSYTGMQPQKYIMAKRLERAREMFENELNPRVKDIALAVGYNDPYYFSRIYKKHFGYAPSKTGYADL